LPLQSLPYILALGFMYGGTVLASRFAVGQFSPTTYVGVRLALAGTAFAVIYLISLQGRHWPRGKELWWKSAVLAVFGTIIPMNFLVFALRFQSSGVTSMLITLNPAITVVLAHFFLADEQLSLRKMFGVILALSGALLMLGLGESGLPEVTQVNPLGYLLAFSAMVSSSVATIFARRTMKGMNLPVGEVIVAPLENSLSGELVCDSAIGGIGLIRSPVRIQARRGKALKVTCRNKNVLSRVNSALKTDSWSGTVGEFAFGINPRARVCDEFLETEKIKGTCHIAFGNNSEFPGGKNPSQNHMDFLITEPTVDVTFKGGKSLKVVERGRFAI